MNLDDFSTVVDEQRYIKPQVALDESNAFIQNLRDSQAQRNTEIAQDTYNLGTAVPSNIGGLGGSGSYFNARYQTPQTNTLIADLKATAQAQALSDAMNNAVSQAKQRYNNAYKNYVKRHRSSGGSGGGRTTPTTDPTKILGDVDFSPSDTADGEVYTFGGKENTKNGLKRDDEASKTWGTNIDDGEVSEVQNPLQPIGDFIGGAFRWIGDRGNDIRMNLPWHRGGN